MNSTLVLFALILLLFVILLPDHHHQLVNSQTPTTATTSYNFRSAQTLPDCRDCVVFEMIQGYTQLWNPEICATKTYIDAETGLTVKGEFAILRSLEASTTVALLMQGRGDIFVGGSDLEEQGVWKWNATGEVFFENATYSWPKFSYNAFESTYVNINTTAAGSSYPVWKFVYVEPSGDFGPTNDKRTLAIVGSGSATDSGWNSVPVNSSSKSTVCSFHNPVVMQLLHKNATDITEQDQIFRLADFHVVSEHVQHADAYTKCKEINRVDPNFINKDSIAGFEVPSDHTTVDGELAYFLFDNESESVADLIRPLGEQKLQNSLASQKLSDVRYHTNETDFGVWLAGNVTALPGDPSTTPPTIVWSTENDGSQLFDDASSPLFDHTTRRCGSLQYCDFIFNYTDTTSTDIKLDPPASLGDGLMMRVNNNNLTYLDRNVSASNLNVTPNADTDQYRWQTQKATEKMPFACVFRFAPMKFLRARSLPKNLTIPANFSDFVPAVTPTPLSTAPGPAGAPDGDNGGTTTAPSSPSSSQNNNNNNGITIIKESSLYQTRFFPRWRSFTQAQAFCESTTSTNAVGDVASGELATVMNVAELNELSQLAIASRVHQMAPTDHEDFGGAWIGLSNTNGDTFSNVNDLENNQLIWSQSGKLSYNSSISWSLRYHLVKDGLMCNASNASSCPTVRVAAATNTNLRVGITFNGTVFTALNVMNAGVATKRPFFCSYRFPLRVNVTSYLAVEYFPTPLPNFVSAQNFCNDRTLDNADPDGKEFRASLGFLPLASLNDLHLFFKHSSPLTIDKSGVYSASIYVGSSSGAANRCLVYNTIEKTYFYDDCASSRPFICQFSVPGSSKTLSKTSSFENFTDSVSHGTTSITKSTSESENIHLSSTNSFQKTRSTREASLSSSVSKSYDLAISGTHVASPSVTHEATPTFALPPTTTPPPATTKAPQVIDDSEEVQTTASVVAVASGTGVVAVQQARLALTKALASCGTGDELEEEPDRLSSPLKLKFGGGKLQWHRGLIISNFVTIIIVAVAMVIITKIYALLTKETMERAFLRTRMPGAMIIPVQILLPPTAQSTVVLFANHEAGGDIVLGIFGLCALIIFPIGCTVYLAWQVKIGKVTLYFNDHEEPTEWAKKHPDFAKTKFYRGLKYLTESVFEYRDTVPDDSEFDKLLLDTTDSPTSEGMRAFKAPVTSYKHHPAPIELLSQNKHFANFGVVYEDFARYQPPVIDVGVSAILGLTAGAAMGTINFASCISIFVINILAAAYHFGNTSYYRCINPRFLQYFTIAGTLLTLCGIILALAQYLVQTFDYDKAFRILALCNGGLGLATAMMGFLGFLNFLYQLFDAYYLRTTEANMQATGVSKPENLDLINIEEELRQLEEAQNAKLLAEEENSKNRFVSDRDDVNSNDTFRVDLDEWNNNTANDAEGQELGEIVNPDQVEDAPLIQQHALSEDDVNTNNNSSDQNNNNQSTTSLRLSGTSVHSSADSMTQAVKAAARNREIAERQAALQNMLENKHEQQKRLSTSQAEYNPNFDEEFGDEEEDVTI